MRQMNPRAGGCCCWPWRSGQDDSPQLAPRRRDEEIVRRRYPTAMATELPHRVTVEEWAALPEDEPGELVDGRLVEEEVPDYIHEVVVGWLIAQLRAWVVPQGGVVGGSEAKFAIGPHHGRKPDVTVYLPASRMPPRRGPVRHPPDLAVEVVSARARDERRDRVEKPDEYARFGIRHYWLIDPETRILEIYELDAAGRYARMTAAAEGHVTLEAFAGLVLDLDALWAETERLADE